MLGKDEILFVGTMFMNTWWKHVSVSRRNANNLGGQRCTERGWLIDIGEWLRWYDYDMFKIVILATQRRLFYALCWWPVASIIIPRHDLSSEIKIVYTI